MSDQFCQCGVQAGYGHQPECPFPLYVEAPDRVAEWCTARDQKVAVRLGAQATDRLEAAIADFAAFADFAAIADFAAFAAAVTVALGTMQAALRSELDPPRSEDGWWADDE